jgi:uncharacterized protein (DUF697 family)
MPMPKLPLGYAKMMLGAVRNGDQALEKKPIVFCGQSGPVEVFNTRLREGATDAGRAVEVYAMRRLQKHDRQALSRAAAIVYGGTVMQGLDDATRDDLMVVGRAGPARLALLEALDLPSPALVEAARVRGIEPDDVIGFRRGAFPHGRAFRALADRVDDSGPWLASQLPALRPFVLDAIIERAARKNAKYAALIFIPGTDLPVLTATQMQMVLRIAAAHGEEVSPARAVELLSVLGAAFGFRALAQSVVGAIPVAGWAAQAAIAYSGTRAVGRAAVEYFERGAVADVSRLRSFAEGVRAEVQARLDRR